MALLMAFVMAILTAAYMLFGRAVLSYHGEQTLYCAAEGQPRSLCLRELKVRLKKQLPFGDVLVADLEATKKAYVLHLRWRFAKVFIRIDRMLEVSSPSLWSR